MSDEHTLAKILIMLFVIELVGILLSYLIGASSNMPSLTQFSSFSTSVGSGINALTNSFNNCGILTCLNPIAIDNTPIVSQLAWIVNIFIYLANIIFRLFNLLWNIFSIIITMIGLLGYLFIVLIPSMLIATGIIGYLLGLGYAFIVIFLAYYIFKIVLGFIGILFGVVSKVI